MKTRYDSSRETVGLTGTLSSHRDLLDAIGEATIITDLEGTVVFWNLAAQRLYGWSANEVLGLPLERFMYSETLRDRADEIMQEIVSEGSWSGEFSVRHKNGTPLWVFVTDSCIFDESGEPTGVMGISTDITRRREIEKALEDSEARLAEAQSLARVGDWSWDLDTDEVKCSEELYRILDLDPSEGVSPRTLLDTIVEEDRTGVQESVEAAISTESNFSFDCRIQREGEVVVHLSNRGTVSTSSEGRGRIVHCICQDFTAQREIEQALHASEERYRTVVEEQTDLVCRFLPDTTLTFVNESYCAYFGVTREEIIGSSFLPQIHEDDRGLYHSSAEPLVLGSGEGSRCVEHRVLTPNGEIHWQQWIDRPIYDGDGRIVEYQSVGRDITERKALEERLQHQALHDPLTGLPNRKLFLDRLDKALNRRRRSADDQHLAVLFLDIDDFKVFNDSLGHEIGDEILRAFGERVRRCLREGDTLARFGGDELTILLQDVESVGTELKVAERIHRSLRDPFVIHERELFVATSIGVARSGAETRSGQDLIRNADTAMYQAKAEGVSYRFFDPRMYERAVSRLRIQNSLRRAIEAEEFSVLYQPIVGLSDGRPWGVEALLRWRHPELGLIAPDEFVPVAEESQLILPMSEWVLKESLSVASRLRRDVERMPPLVMSVNVSAKQFSQPNLEERFVRIMQDAGVDPWTVNLDITERVYVEGVRENASTIDSLRDLGIKISIDDFGVGYSSFAYLKTIPADILKLDKAFIANLGEDVADTAIVQTVVDLAHTVSLEVVAEGVESESQASLLKEMGCDFAQGFYLSEPLAEDELRVYLKNTDCKNDSIVQ